MNPASSTTMRKPRPPHGEPQGIASVDQPGTGPHVINHPPATHDGPTGASGRSRRRVSARRRLATLSWFTRQFYVLVISGMPLVEAVAALQRQARDEHWSGVLHGVRSELEGGSSLAEAMEVHSHYFDSVYRSLIAAGESGGRLDAMLKRLAELTAQQLRTRRAIVGAMIYPALLIIIAAAALSVMLVVVLPKFAGLFETLDVPLPPTTRWLMAISDCVRGYWWIVIAGAATAITGLVFTLKTRGGRRAKDSFVLRTPKLGPIIRDFATERIARLLGVLISSNVSVLEAMALVRQAMSNVHYTELLESAEQAVGRGEPISSVLADAELINPSVYEAVRSGEQSGQVGSLLVDIADFLDEENRAAIRSLTNILEPLILVVLGVIIGFVAVSLFLPLFDLTAMT